MHPIVRTMQYAVITGVLASGLYVVEQIASQHLPADPYAPPHRPYVAVGQLTTDIVQNVSRFEVRCLTEVAAFWRYGAE
jgi:hypothetical protein